jgi:ribonuclease BN (tRNA processing enzyme)
VTLGMMGSTITFHELTEQTFSVGSLSVEVLYMNHTSLALGFRITEGEKTLCYCTDTEPHALLMEPREGGIGQDFIHKGDKRFVEFIRRSDLMIIDTQYSNEEYAMKKGWGHGSIDYVTYVALLGDVKRLCLFHHDPEHNDDIIDSFKDHCARKIGEFGAAIDVFGAQEGKELQI